MVTYAYDKHFQKQFKKIKNSSFKSKILKQIEKIINTPDIGKPMKYSRKGTREVYIAPFRLVYAFLEKEEKIIFLDIYHKDEQ
jgi:mRNA-degrading endonuclease RelE of RelBE toxin-antitoxin system